MLTRSTLLIRLLSAEDGDDGGDTTDEEEDLPMPTPCHASKLRRVTVSSTTVLPQIINTNKEGPELRAWVADPSRPICVIEGSKQIFLIPDAYRQFSVSDRTGSTTSDQWLPPEGEGESESEQSAIPATFDPMLSELGGGDVGLLGAGDLLGPEGFIPEEGADTFSDLFNEEDYDVDEFEAGLEINDFLDLSSTEEGTSEAGNDVGGDLSDDCGAGGEEGEEEECLPGQNADADMLSIWDKVSVTAFRKRQIQHNQKLSSALQFGGNGYHKGKEGRLSETITPTKKRRVRQKFLVSNHGGMGNNPVVRKKPAR